jgi:hypothetical protein
MRQHWELLARQFCAPSHNRMTPRKWTTARTGRDKARTDVGCAVIDGRVHASAHLHQQHSKGEHVDLGRVAPGEHLHHNTS